MGLATATFVNPQHCGAGFVRGENNELHIAANLVGRTGRIIDEYDTGYDVERPTGEEPVLYLVDFDGLKVWVESEALNFHRAI